jgi:hypothetical protein
MSETASVQDNPKISPAFVATAYFLWPIFFVFGVRLHRDFLGQIVYGHAASLPEVSLSRTGRQHEGL